MLKTDWFQLQHTCNWGITKVKESPFCSPCLLCQTSHSAYFCTKSVEGSLVNALSLKNSLPMPALCQQSLAEMTTSYKEPVQRQWSGNAGKQWNRRLKWDGTSCIFSQLFVLWLIVCLHLDKQLHCVSVSEPWYACIISAYCIIWEAVSRCFLTHIGKKVTHAFTGF